MVTDEPSGASATSLDAPEPRACRTAPSSGIGVLPELGYRAFATTPTRSVFGVTLGNGCSTTSAALVVDGVVAPYACVKSAKPFSLGGSFSPTRRRWPSPRQ